MTVATDELLRILQQGHVRHHADEVFGKDMVAKVISDAENEVTSTDQSLHHAKCKGREEVVAALVESIQELQDENIPALEGMGHHQVANSRKLAVSIVQEALLSERLGDILKMTVHSTDTPEEWTAATEKRDTLIRLLVARGVDMSSLSKACGNVDLKERMTLPQLRTVNATLFILNAVEDPVACMNHYGVFEAT